MTESSTNSALIRAATAAAIEEAAARLTAGELVAFPTETVYGLGADATNDEAVARIFEAKGRPSFNPLIVHVASAERAHDYIDLPDAGRRLAEAFWPGPLTLVAPRATPRTGANPVSLLASAGLDTLAVRVPGHPVAQALLKTCGLPVAAPSANRSGQVSPTTAAHVAEELGERVSLILDGGACPIGIESTVVGFADGSPVLLRPGSVTREMIEAAAGPLGRETGDAERPSAPGQLASHYAPRARVRLNVAAPAAGEALLAFGPEIPPDTEIVRNLSERGDLVEAAAHLFAYLRELDASGVTSIAVMPIPETGLGEAINDRLRRAAAPRA